MTRSSAITTVTGLGFAVELHGHHVGDLVGERSTFDFVAAPDAVERHGVGSVVLSLAVPLTTRSPARRVATRRAYFAGLLPEGDGAKVLAISPRCSVMSRRSRSATSPDETSLAGVQPKVTLARVDGAWMRAVDGAPTTHIV